MRFYGYLKGEADCNYLTDDFNTDYQGIGGATVGDVNNSGAAVGAVSAMQLWHTAPPNYAINDLGIEGGAGWVRASCDNPSGCITVGWNPNNDGNKGTGWKFKVSCEERGFPIVVCPPMDVVQAAVTHLNNCTVTNGSITIPLPDVTGCADNDGDDPKKWVVRLSRLMPMVI